MNRLSRRAVISALLAAAGFGAAQAQEPFPSKPVRVIVTSAPGGFLDVTTRLVARYMSDKLGQQVIVENRAGAGGLVAIRGMKTTPADGYTLLAAVNTLAVQQAINKEAGYDVTRDFVGVGPINSTPFLLVTGTTQPDANLPALLARAKANPGKVTYASAGNGSTTHLGAAYFAQRAGLNLVHVPYKGNSAAWPDLVAGRVGLILEPYGTSVAMIREGRLKPLGVTSNKRIDVLPEVPTIAEQGVSNYNFILWVGLLAPAGTPKDVVEKLNAALRSALATPEVRNRFRDEGSEAMNMSPAEFDRFLREQVAETARLVNDLGLKE